MDLSTVEKELRKVGLTIPSKKVEISFTKSSDLRFPFCPGDDSGSIALGSFLVSDSYKIVDRMEKFSIEELLSLGIRDSDIVVSFLKNREKHLYRVYDEAEDYIGDPLKLGLYSLGYYLKYDRRTREVLLFVNRHTELCRELKRVSGDKHISDINKIISKAEFRGRDAVNILGIFFKYSLFIPIYIDKSDGVSINYSKKGDLKSSLGANILDSERIMSFLSSSKVMPESFKVIPGNWYFVYADKGLDCMYLKRDMNKNTKKG